MVLGVVKNLFNLVGFVVKIVDLMIWWGVEEICKKFGSMLYIVIWFVCLVVCVVSKKKGGFLFVS